MPLKAVINSKGLTLIEVLISLVIVSTSLVFVLNALAKVAEAQKEVEVRSSAYDFLTSRMAELEQRVQPLEDLKEKVQGYFRAKELRYDWILSTGFAGAAPSAEETNETDVPQDQVLLTKDLQIVWKRGADDAEIRLSTLSITPPPRTNS